MAVAELNFFKGNHIQDNSSISKSLEILTPVVAWHPETLMLMATLMLQLPVEKCNEAILLITLILTESELDFLGVQESKGLNLEVHILEVVSTTLVHATTIELSFDQRFTSQVGFVLWLQLKLHILTSIPRHLTYHLFIT